MKKLPLFILVSANVISLITYTAYAESIAEMQTQLESQSQPASKEYVNQQISLLRAQIQGTFTSNSWISACPTGAAGLLAGCFTDGISASNSPIGTLINGMWAGINTMPTSAANSVFIKKFPARYVFTVISGRGLTYSTTQIPNTSKAWCTTDAIAENGLDIDCHINNDPNSATNNNCIYNVSVSGEGFKFNSTVTEQILQSTPNSGTALPLGIPIYIVCIGANTSTGAPASIAGMSVR